MIKRRYELEIKTTNDTHKSNDVTVWAHCENEDGEHWADCPLHVMEYSDGELGITVDMAYYNNHIVDMVLTEFDGDDDIRVGTGTVHRLVKGVEITEVVRRVMMTWADENL